MFSESTSYSPEDFFDVIDGSKGCKQMATKINIFTPVFFWKLSKGIFAFKLLIFLQMEI